MDVSFSERIKYLTMKLAVTPKPPKSTSGKAVDCDNPPWSEEILGPPVMRRGRDPEKVPTKCLMKKRKGKAHPRGSDKDTMRPEYDFSKADRGVTAAQYAEGANVVVLDPDAAALVPDFRAANEASSRIGRSRRTLPRKRPGTRTS